MLIIVLALWLIAISLLLRFFAVSSGPRCSHCRGELEVWPDRRCCADCGLVFAAPGQWRRETEAGLLHADPADDLPLLHAAAERLARAPQLAAPLPYQRAITGSTRSANKRTLS